MKKMIVMMIVVACTATGLLANPNPLNAENALAAEPPQLCTIEIKGTYDGKAVDVKVTVEAENCARAAGDLLKQIVNKK